MELGLWFGPAANLATFTERTLGPVGKWAAAALYTFAYVATLTAYIAEAASLAQPVLHALGVLSHPALPPAVFVMLLGSVVYAGTRQVRRSGVRSTRLRTRFHPV